MYSPQTLFIKEIEDKLSTSGIPVKFELPPESFPEPFYVIGSHNANDSRSAKFGRAITDLDIQVTLFYPINSRAELEEEIFKTKMALNIRGVTHQMTIDDSVGRKVYQVIFHINQII